MKTAAKLVFVFYAIAALSDLLFIYQQADDLRWISKPLLMPLLITGFAICFPLKKGKPYWLIVAALFLSWCGDMLLQAEGLFIPGLLSFLLAHVAYILYFNNAGRNGKGFLQKRPVLALSVVVYVILLLVLLFPFLGQLKIPVIIYGVTIGTMLLMAISIRDQLAPGAFVFFLTGALLFVMSDSILAIHLFVAKQPMLGIAVMVTYAAAQYFIVQGALVNAVLDQDKSSSL